MDNASKALIIAGGMLIAIMIASLFVYLFTTYGTYADNIYDRIYQRQLTEANNEYTQYEGSNENTIYDVVTVINKAKDNNSSLKLSPGDRGYISVRLVGVAGAGSNVQNLDNDAITQLLQTHAQNGTKFKCNVLEADGLISTVIFTKV